MNTALGIGTGRTPLTRVVGSSTQERKLRLKAELQSKVVQWRFESALGHGNTQHKSPSSPTVRGNHQHDA